MAFALTLVYVALNFLRAQELYPELIRFQPMNVLGLLAMGVTVLMLAIGHRPNLRGLELPLGLSFLLWSAFSVAAALGWLGGAVLTLQDLSVSFFAYVLVVLNATTLRRLGLVVLVAIGSLLVVLLLAGRAYYSGTESSPFFILTASRGSIDYLVDSGDSAEDSAGEEGESALPRSSGSRVLGFSRTRTTSPRPWPPWSRSSSCCGGSIDRLGTSCWSCSQPPLHFGASC